MHRKCQKSLHVLAMCIISVILPICSGCSFSLYQKTYVETTRPAKMEVLLAQYQAQQGQTGDKTMKAGIAIPPEVIAVLTNLMTSWLDVWASVKKEVTQERAVSVKWLTFGEGNGAISTDNATHNKIGSINTAPKKVNK